MTGPWRDMAVAAVLASALACGGPAVAQNVSGAFSGGKNAEIRIESDVMEVEQKKNRATFTGRVDARRGGVRLRSAKLTVFYQEAGAGAKSRTELTKLDARGKVVVTSKGQRATSDWAIMMVQTGKVTMGGNVVLTEGKTVIKGNKLELDLNTGRSKLFGGKSSGGRVKGVFLPARK